MNRKFAATALSAFLYAQGLLGFAAVAAVLIKHNQPAADAVASISAAAVRVIPT